MTTGPPPYSERDVSFGVSILSEDRFTKIIVPASIRFVANSIVLLALVTPRTTSMVISTARNAPALHVNDNQRCETEVSNRVSRMMLLH